MKVMIPFIQISKSTLVALLNSPTPPWPAEGNIVWLLFVLGYLAGFALAEAGGRNVGSQDRRQKI
eukprot:scaffold88876_cov50-Prasinocladus_malaysianus.AAC.1